MPFVLIIIGLTLIVASARGTLPNLGKLLKDDFTGPNNFFLWLIAIGTVGMLGYYKPGEKFSRAFMALILIAMVIRNGGFYEKLVEALGDITDGGSTGAGPAGNLVAPGTAPVLQGGSGQGAIGSGAMTDNLGVGRYTASSPEVQGLIKGATAIQGAIKNPVGTVANIAKSIPIIGGFF